MSKYCRKCVNLLIVASIALLVLSGCGEVEVTSTESIQDTSTECITSEIHNVLETETMVVETTKTEEELFVLAKEQAHVFFEEIVGIYYDEVSDGIIRVQAAESAGFNSYANFEIVGLGFGVLYDTYCGEFIDDSYYFYVNNVCYRMEDKRAEGKIVIYSGTSKDNCDEICSSFGIY